MRKYVRIKSRFIILAVSMFLVLSGCSTKNSTDSSDKIKIVAAENFYSEVAEAVGGELVKVVSLLTSPNMDPHDFEPTPQVSKDVDAAQIVIYNGIGYDEWMVKLIEATGKAKDKSVIAVGSDVMGKKAGDNEHLWYNPLTFPQFAKDLSEILVKLDPENADTYIKQANAYIATLTTVTNLVNELKQIDSVPIAVSEPVFDYMAEALNLTITNKKFAVAAEESVDPAPASVGQLQDDIKAKKIKMFINNTQSSSPLIENMVTLSKENTIPVIEVTETLPQGKTYIQWMTDILTQIKSALK